MRRERAWIIGAGALVLAAGVAVAVRRRAGHDPVQDFHGFVRRSVATPAGTMNYYEASAGQPLIFLHGLSAGASASSWRKVAPAFVRRYRVIVVDWIGWGLSERPQRQLQHEDYVVALDALVRQFDQPVLVIAQTEAIGFALELALIKPELFKRMVLLPGAGSADQPPLGSIQRLLRRTHAAQLGLADEFELDLPPDLRNLHVPVAIVTEASRSAQTIQAIDAALGHAKPR